MVSVSGTTLGLMARLQRLRAIKNAEGKASVQKRTVQQIALFYVAARSRAQRRDSLWNLILIPLGLSGLLASWYGLFRLVWTFHVFLYPQHSLGNFWQKDISFSSFAPSFLMVFAVAPGALCVGLIFANCMSWLLPPARRVFDAESVGCAGASFREATGALVKVALWVVPAGLIIALVSGTLLRSLK